MIPRFVYTIVICLNLTGVGSIWAQGGYGGMRSQPPPSKPVPTAPTTVRQQQQQKKTEHVIVAGGSDVTAGIQQYVDAASKKSSDKKFHIKHAGQDIALGSLKVHDDRMADLGGGKYVACTDMRGADGKAYDVDFFLTGQRGNLKVTEASVHKIDGNALYSWKKQGSVWKMSR